jgi:hypothetical protein
MSMPDAQQRDRGATVADDRIAIASLVSRIGLAVDQQDRNAYPHYWTEDALLSYTSVDGQEWRFEGRAAIVTFVEAVWESGGAVPIHVTACPTIEIDGDEATGRYYAIQLHPRAGGATPAGLADYVVTARRQPGSGAWQLSSMIEIQRKAYDRL